MGKQAFRAVRAGRVPHPATEALEGSETASSNLANFARWGSQFGGSTSQGCKISQSRPIKRYIAESGTRMPCNDPDARWSIPLFPCGEAVSRLVFVLLWQRSLHTTMTMRDQPGIQHKRGVE